MRNTLSYAPAPVPQDPELLPQYLQTELLKLKSVIRSVIEGGVEVYHTAPDRVWDGRMVLADGSDWDPGYGEGVYVYYAGDWQLLCIAPCYEPAI